MEKQEANESVKSNPTRFEMYCEKIGINPNLVMLKVTLFMSYGAAAALIPFLTIHMQSIGLTVEEIAVIYLALPLTTFLSPPLTGFLVDKLGQYKVVLILSLVLNGVFHQSLMLIPQMEIPGENPEAYVMRHPSTGKVEVWWSPCPSRECPEQEELNLVLHDCLDHCILRDVKSKTPGILAGIHQSIAVRPPSFLDPPAGCHGSPIHPNKPPTFGIVPEELHFHRDNPKKNVTTSTSKPKKRVPADNTVEEANKEVSGIVPTLPTTTIGPDRSRTKERTSPTSPPNTTSEEEEPFVVLLDMHPDPMVASEQLGIELEPEEDESVTDFRMQFSKELLLSHGVNYTELEEADLRCGGYVMATNLTYNTLKELASDCMLQKCAFREGGPEVCPPNYKESDDKVFWIYFCLRFLGTTMMNAAVTVMDPIALTMVQQYGGQFGRERLFSTLGMAVFSPLSGYLIDYSSRKLGYTDYSAAFYTYSVLLVISSLSVLLMPVGAKMPADNLLRDMVKLLKMPHVIIFIFFIFGLGNCWGFIESYLFLYLKELGARNYLLGVTVTVGTISSIPFLYGADGLIKKIGHVNLIIIAFFSHAARLVGYSYIENAWWCFPFEAMESFSVHLMWVSAATYCSIIAPRRLLATLIGILGMAHFSLGRGSGSFSGGLLIGSVGIRQSFRYMGLGSVIAGLLYTTLHFFWLHKYTDSKDKFTKTVSDSGQSEKMQTKEEEERQKIEDLNMERLSLMIRFNHRGSLSSLSAEQLKGINSRRNSTTSEVTRSLLGPRSSINGPSIVRTNKVGEVVTPNQVRKAPTIAVPEEFRKRSDSILEEDENQAEEALLRNGQSATLPPAQAKE